MSPRELLGALERLGRPRMLVLGDLMLDRYTRGEADRISPEAPVMVLRAGESDERPGGAANVANLLRELEAQVVCGGVIGNDEAGLTLLKTLEGRGVDTSLVVVDAARPTTVKERFVGLSSARRWGQILRVDRESTEPLPAALEEQILAKLPAAIRDASVVLISDYGKGFCTPRIVRAAIEGARRCGAPALVDPARLGGFERYRGATLLKPNRGETEQAAGARIAVPQDAVAIGGRLCKELDLEMAVVTLDCDGMALIPRGGPSRVYPAHARDVADITGAGDMVLATLGLCLAEGVPPAVAAPLANAAAGLEVQREGVAVISREEIRRELRNTLIPAGGSQRILDPPVEAMSEIA